MTTVNPKPVLIIDPSDKWRPEKSEDEFRNYTSNNAYHKRVKNTYYQMHTNQSVKLVKDRWSTVGDTFPVGCAFSDTCVFGNESFASNEDYENPQYNTDLGMYQKNCGLSNVLMSWGHDEYLYRVLKNHPSCTLPEEALTIIRFHSFYPWHTHSAYTQLCDNRDMDMLPWVQRFNTFDLYTKADKLPDMEALKPYYQALVEQYIPGKVKF